RVGRELAVPALVEAVEAEPGDVHHVAGTGQRDVGRGAGHPGAPHHPGAAGAGHRDAGQRAVPVRRRPDARQAAGGGVEGRRPEAAVTGARISSLVRIRARYSRSTLRFSPGGSAGLLIPNSRPPSSGRQYRPALRSNTIGTRDGSRPGCCSVTATWCRTPPAGVRIPASAPPRASLGPPVSTTTGACTSPSLVRTPRTRPPPDSRPRNATPSATRTPLDSSATV